MTYHDFWHRLAQVYDEGEAKAIARLVYEVRYGLTLTDLCMGKDTLLAADDQALLEQALQRLERQEPVQYVLGVTEFCRRTFRVNRHVLIPRPETEELCRWVIEKEGRPAEGGEHKAILDMGTGSGCIAVTLAAELAPADVTAWDISDEALTVAAANARRNHVTIRFDRQDMLTATAGQARWDVIVSNPPYICNKEREAMAQNVLAHEPHTALFVPDDDPLLFYRAIATYGQKALKPGGGLYLELNPLYAADLRHLLSMLSWHDITLRHDQYGKPRMMSARR